MAKHAAVASVLLVLVASVSLSYAQSTNECSPENVKRAMSLAGAQEDFTVARCVGRTVLDNSAERTSELFALFGNHPRILKQTAFVSGRFSAGFMAWFITSSFTMWARPESVRDNGDQLVAIETAAAAGFHAEVLAHPFIEGWIIINDRPTRFPLATTTANRPTVLSVTSDERGPGSEARTWRVTLAPNRQLQHVWPPVFRDIDADGRPEVWVRYNATGGDGFAQVLEQYRLDDSTLTLEKQFRGEAEGIARLLDDGTVEVGSGFSASNAGHLNFDRHRVERFRYVAHNWTKVETKVIPHLLAGDEWRAYYDLGERR
jgi:hypothetical protein